MKIKSIILTNVLLFMGILSYGQSKSFEFGKWVEINNALLKELNTSYVDTLPLNRMEKVGIKAMLANIDPYTIYIPKEENSQFKMMIEKTYGGIGAIIYKPKKEDYLIINEPYRYTPSAMAGLTCGDTILEINGISTKGKTAAECTKYLKGTPGTELTLKVKKVRTGKIEDIKLKRQLIHLPDIECYGMLNDTTGYVSQSGFTPHVADSLKKAFLFLKKKGMKKFVLDLRGNGGGMLSEAQKIVSLFVPKGSLVVTQRGKSLNGDIEYRTMTDPIDTLMPIVILVNGGTASASEIVSGALQDRDRATIIGTRTFGKGLVQGIRSLPYGGQLKVTIAKYYTPSGRCVQAIDYAKRDKNGSVKHIPDSLTHEFKTLHGRKVRDGGGITPDVIIQGDSLANLTYSLIMNMLINDYPLRFVKTHATIAPPGKFHLTDADYQDFIKFAESKKFDFRSPEKVYFEDFVKALKDKELKKKLKSELDSINKAITLTKEQALLKYKKEIIPLLEADIISRYYFRPAALLYNTKNDKQLQSALKAKLITVRK